MGPTTFTAPIRTAPRPASAAAARLSRASLAVGALGLATALFLVTRMIASWRISPRAHTLTLLGQQFAYPAANVAGIAVLVLALVGLCVTITALAAAVREIRDARRLTAQLGQLGLAGRLADGTLVIEDCAVHAFCAGLLRPRVYVTTEALQRLDEDALAAVLAHERHHVQRRDPLRMAAGRVLARALFFLPWLQALTDRHRSLAELSADESAAARGRPALARAMLAFEEGRIEPERVEQLLGEGDSLGWRFPIALTAAALTATATLAGVAILAARFASGTATLAPPFLSRQPCVIVLAMIPAVAALLGWRRVGRMRPAWLVSSSRESSLGAHSSG
jgi:Zn-dependent protease with chaperone function